MAIYQIPVCYFMAHEHFLKEHIYLHTERGDTPALEYRRLRSHISKLVTSRFFQKWCSSGVVSAFPLRETIDFTDFFGTFQDTAVLPLQIGSCLLNLFNLNQQHHRSTHFITHSRHTHHICRRHCFLNSLNLKTTFYKWVQYLR